MTQSCFVRLSGREVLVYQLRLPCGGQTVVVAQLVLQVGELAVKRVGGVGDAKLSPPLEHEQMRQVVAQASVGAPQGLVGVEGLARLLVRGPFLQHLPPFLLPCVKHPYELRLGAADQLERDGPQFLGRHELRLPGQVFGDRLDLVELAGLDRNVREGLDHPLATVTHNRLYADAAPRNLGNPRDILFHRLVPHILLQQHHSVQAVLEHHHPELPTEVRGVHHDIGHWRELIRTAWPDLVQAPLYRPCGAPVLLSQLLVGLLAFKVFGENGSGVSSVPSKELLPTGMAFIQLPPVRHAIFLRNRAATMNALFLFITFERTSTLVITELPEDFSLIFVH